MLQRKGLPWTEVHFGSTAATCLGSMWGFGAGAMERAGYGMAWCDHGMYFLAQGHVSLQATTSSTVFPGGQCLGSSLPSPVTGCCLSLVLSKQPSCQGPAGFALKHDLVPHHHRPCPGATCGTGHKSCHSSAMGVGDRGCATAPGQSLFLPPGQPQVAPLALPGAPGLWEPHPWVQCQSGTCKGCGEMHCHRAVL